MDRPTYWTQPKPSRNARRIAVLVLLVFAAVVPIQLGRPSPVPPNAVVPTKIGVIASGEILSTETVRFTLADGTRVNVPRKRSFAGGAWTGSVLIVVDSSNAELYWYAIPSEAGGFDVGRGVDVGDDIAIRVTVRSGTGGWILLPKAPGYVERPFRGGYLLLDLFYINERGEVIANKGAPVPAFEKLLGL